MPVMYRSFVVIAAILLFLLLSWIVLAPGRGGVCLGRNSRCHICLTVRGREPKLEQSIAGLLWLMDTSRLYGGIVIQGVMLDAETRNAALALAQQYRCITFIEDGEAPWIKTGNCWK